MTLPLNLILFSRLLNAKTITPTSLTVMDDLTLPGFYYLKNKELNSMVYNAHLIVSANDDNSCILQLMVPEIMDDENAGLVYRLRFNGAWTEWKRVMSESQINIAIERALKQHGLIK